MKFRGQVLVAAVVAISVVGLLVAGSSLPSTGPSGSGGSSRLSPSAAATWHLVTTAALPGARYQMAQVSMLDTTGWIVVYGGLGRTGAPLADTWIWTGASWVLMNRCTTPPTCVNPPATWGASAIQSDITVWMF